MRYKTDEWQSHLLANFITVSPSLAEGFVQIGFDGVEEVCGIDVVLIQLDAVGRGRGEAEEKESETSCRFSQFKTIDTMWQVVSRYQSTMNTI